MAEIKFDIEVSQAEFLQLVELCVDAGIYVPLYKGNYLTTRKRLLYWLTDHGCTRNEKTGAWDVPEELMPEFTAILDDVKSEFKAKNPGLRFEASVYFDEFL